MVKSMDKKPDCFPKKKVVAPESVVKIENGRNITDRVVIKSDKRAKYVDAVEVPAGRIHAWELDRSEAAERKESFYVAHPKSVGAMHLLNSPQLFIVEKIPGKYKLAPFMGSETSVWVDTDDVEDNPVYGSQVMPRPQP